MTTIEDIQRHMSEDIKKACAIPKSFFGGTCTTATASTMNHATIDEIRAKMLEATSIIMKRHIIDNAAMMLGMPTRESLMATTTKPNKVHKHRRGQTESYHARIQKKWNKRFGTEQVPGAFILDNRAIGLFGVDHGKTMVIHPSLAEKLRRATK